MKGLAIIAYFLIFLPGSMILIPWGLFLLTGIFTAELNYKVMIILADISLIFLAYHSFKPLTKQRLFIEFIVFLFLLLPIIIIVAKWPLQTFGYFLFIAPLLVFVVLYLISFWRHIKSYKRSKMIIA